MCLQSGDKVFPRETISQNVVHGLEIERLLDFGVWGKVEMEQDQEWDEGRKENIYEEISAVFSQSSGERMILPVTRLIVAIYTSRTTSTSDSYIYHARGGSKIGLPPKPYRPPFI